MAVGFPPQYTETLAAGKSKVDLSGAVKAAVKTLNWSVKQEAPDQIVARTGFNLLTIVGERVTVKFLPDRSLSITSSSLYFFQWFDYGKNRSNVRKLLAGLKKQL